MASASLSESEMAIIRKGLTELEKEAAEAVNREKVVIDEEKSMPWNVDTISKEGFSKTVVNKPVPRGNDDLTEEQREIKMKEYVTAHEDDIKKFGWMQKFDDSKAFMTEKPFLACEETANYLVIHCLNLAMKEKFGAMDQVAHQCICVQYLLELSRQLDIDPRSCISSFFTKYVWTSYTYRALGIHHGSRVFKGNKKRGPYFGLSFSSNRARVVQVT
jgi:cell division cycle protein 37